LGFVHINDTKLGLVTFPLRDLQYELVSRGDSATSQYQRDLRKVQLFALDVEPAVAQVLNFVCKSIEVYVFTNRNDVEKVRKTPHGWSSSGQSVFAVGSTVPSSSDSKMSRVGV
jgi:hypothetical protein